MYSVNIPKQKPHGGRLTQSVGNLCVTSKNNTDITMVYICYMLLYTTVFRHR